MNSGTVLFLWSKESVINEGTLFIVFCVVFKYNKTGVYIAVIMNISALREQRR